MIIKQYRTFKYDNGGFIVKKKAASRLDEHDQTLEFAALPVTESETATLPVIEAETKVEAPSDEGVKDSQDVRILELRIAELEDKFVKLQTELSILTNKKKKKKEKVKCKCKDKKVDIPKCKCKSKKLAKEIR